MLRRSDTPAATSTAVTASADQPSATVEVHPAPTRAGQIENPLETSLVESGPLLISLNPFEGEDEPIIRPTLGAHPGAAAVLTETIHIESSTERPLEAGAKAPEKLAGAKAPRKQATPKWKERKTPYSGALRYVPKAQDIKEAKGAGYLYPDDPIKEKPFLAWSPCIK